MADLAASVTPLLGLSAAEYQSRASFEERVGWTGHTRVGSGLGSGDRLAGFASSLLQEFVESLRVLRATPPGPSATLLSLLLSTAHLERALGDVSGWG